MRVTHPTGQSRVVNTQRLVLGFLKTGPGKLRSTQPELTSHNSQPEAEFCLLCLFASTLKLNHEAQLCKACLLLVSSSQLDAGLELVGCGDWPKIA